MSKLLGAIFVVFFNLPTFAQSVYGLSQCANKAAEVITTKGNYRKEKTTVIKIAPTLSKNPHYEGFHVFVNVQPAYQASFKQVCKIYLRKSNCSYEGYLACSSSLDELKNNF